MRKSMMANVPFNKEYIKGHKIDLFELKKNFNHKKDLAWKTV